MMCNRIYSYQVREYVLCTQKGVGLFLSRKEGMTFPYVQLSVEGSCRR